MSKHYNLILDWQYHKQTYFSCKLLDLFCKADSSNQQLLASVYPEQYEAYLYWLNGRFTKERGIND